MKRLSFLFVALLLTLPTLAWANDTQVRLSISETQPALNQDVTVEVWLDNMPAMYGGESHLTFDPQMFEVVDANPDENGIQLLPGSFLDPEQGFMLQNQADNQAGTIDYALTLLNPALPVEGSGIFFSLTLRPKAAGETTIQVSKSLFGTRNAQEIEHTTQELTLEIGGESGSLWDEYGLYLLAAVVLLAFIAGFVGSRLGAMRNRQAA